MSLSPACGYSDVVSLAYVPNVSLDAFDSQVCCDWPLHTLPFVSLIYKYIPPLT
jgi:hypothetical protein